MTLLPEPRPAAYPGFEDVPAVRKAMSEQASPPKADEPRKGDAIALFTFDSDNARYLSFKKGDVITVTKKTNNSYDWWYVDLLH